MKLDEGSNTASGLGIEILDANMRPVKLNDLHAGMQWIPLVPEQNNILPYSARLKSTQKSVNPGLVRASATKMAIAKRLLLMRSLVMHSFHLRQELSR
ncbi:fimbrial family protein [Escherichia coli 1-176-05_S4_C2]|nr:fimbrial family protein [Escherichia coli 1-110-08_S4_C3]EYE02068.1 fimbrial family protein [Escherichia coli 1-110-08_S4_C2]EZJ25360.1 fimbrial family protein [Escherichia coli 1-176-05_S4_C3]EZJ71780.1 fimbrial family protein [Escherichia coli 1-176-05_S4_C1]KDA88226.1 fimbrial family protein [Escherichia coli 1-176-05_S4_C2]KDT63732.1 fimbrial family protein [Escherichia coli 3-267-03_S3_C1]